MNASEIKQFKTAISILVTKPHILNDFYSSGRLKLCPEGMFVISLIIEDKLNNTDLTLYSTGVHQAVDIYKREMYAQTVITGDFYNKLRIRYLKLLNVAAKCDTNGDQCGPEHLAWMLIELGSTNMSETKKHRWLGYIQCGMVHLGLITVNKEREFTRGIFNGK